MIYSSDGMKQRIEQIKKGSNKSQNCSRIWIKQNIFNGQENIGTQQKSRKVDIFLEGPISIWFWWIIQKSSKDIYLYSDNGKKQVKWKELRPNFCDEAQVSQFGEYVNDERNGSWNTFIQQLKFVVGKNFNRILQEFLTHGLIIYCEGQ